MQLGLTEPLSSIVKARFATAKASQALTFSSTELAIIHSTAARAPFQLRYCPALAKKPNPNNDASKPVTKTQKPDPFDNPPSDLLLATFPHPHPSHLLVLNKYPVIPSHFILATTLNKPQTHALEPADLTAAYACLKAWEGEGHGDEGAGKGEAAGKLFAFFNSGPHSGASQPHRHLQFLPVEEMRADQGDKEAWGLLVERVLECAADPATGLKSHPTLPLTHYALDLPPQPSTDTLQRAYNTLYTAALRAVRAYVAETGDQSVLVNDDGGPDDAEAGKGKALPMSYNLAMTRTGMAICPRRREGVMVGGNDGEEGGFVAVNGTVLAGTLMVKGVREWEVLKGKGAELDRVLEAVGIPRVG